MKSRQPSGSSQFAFATAVNRAGTHGRTTAAESRRAISLTTVLVSLVIVILGTVAGASTLVAIRTSEARKQAAADFDRASEMVNQCAINSAKSEGLQGFRMSKTREDLLKPLLAYYEGYLAAHAKDEVLSPEVAEAHFRIAGIRAKLGSNKSVQSLALGLAYLNKMNDADIDPETFPSPEECAMGIAAPQEWMQLKGASFKEMGQHAAQMLMTMGQANVTYRMIVRKHPTAVKPRQEWATFLKYSAAIQDLARRKDAALAQWTQARDLLEALSREQPGNSDYKPRLAEAQTAIAKLQKEQKQNDEAIASYEKALALCEELAAAAPDDKTLAKDVDAINKELEKLRAAPKEKPKEAAAEVAASPAGDATPPPADGASPPEPGEAAGATETPPQEAPSENAAPPAGAAAADASAGNP